MIRPVLTEIALFATPFALYALFLFATRAGVLDMQEWPPKVLGWLTAAAFILMIGSFFIFAQYSGVEPGKTYVPAHVEDGKFVPGTAK